MGPSGPRGSLAPMSEQQREIRVGLPGCGNVGGALVPLVAERADEIARRTGVRLSIERVAVRNTARDRGIDFGDGVLTHDAMSVVTDPDIDIFDREAVFIERHLIPLRRQFPQLRVVFEHITTEQAAQFVADGDPLMAATITPHHLHINRNAMFQGGLRSDFYCLPVAKRERHRLALRQAATSGDPSFFLGTDSAPHPRAGKESSCGCAGIYNAPYALESYLAVFEAEGALQHFEAFASENGPRFYKLPLNEDTITLERTAQLVPAQLEGQGLVPFHASEVLDWRLAD